eukprot:scaffold373901_cov51-Attheya_sp.AAC.1
MLAYSSLANSDATNLSTRSGSYNQIETIVECMFKGIPQAKKQHKQEQQRTKLGVLSSDTNTVKEAYEAQGERRCRNQNVQPAGDDDGNESEDERVDIHKMQQIQLSHRGSHQEMAYLDREVSRYVNDTIMSRDMRL